MFKQTTWSKKTIFEKSSINRIGHLIRSSLSSQETPLFNQILQQIPQGLLRDEPPKLPELSELDVIRHFTRLSQMNYGVDSGFYPLGSCTMKYNPKICDTAANLPNAQNMHPYQKEETVQGSLQIMYELASWLAELSGMKRVTLQPAAGAHGEYTGLMILRSYHEVNGTLEQKREIIVPDSAHGTNPATATMCGFKTVVIPSQDDGCVDIDALKAATTSKTAGIMLTNPSTLGLFEPRIAEITSTIHAVDGLAYYDGANFNAIMGKVRPGDMGFDIVHFNLHKTFATPHGGGGPGAGPVGVVEKLVPYLPVPIVEFDEKSRKYFFQNNLEHSIGKVRSYFGNFSTILRAYTYILCLGREGLTRVSEMAVLNANYMKSRSQNIKGFSVPYGKDAFCMHEYVLSARELAKNTGVTALDVSKYLLDKGIHPPTVYFPLIVKEALMTEPTETESLETMDEFIAVLEEISEAAYAGQTAEISASPNATSVRRIDDVKAARKPIVSFRLILEAQE